MTHPVYRLDRTQHGAALYRNDMLLGTAQRELGGDVYEVYVEGPADGGELLWYGNYRSLDEACHDLWRIVERECALREWARSNQEALPF